VVERGKVITAAGVSSGIDMALPLAAGSPATTWLRASSSAWSTTRSRRSTLSP
jgi:transcriptional regulator GlxA family with amidase domain